jgi:hypothetical protein
MTNGVKESSLGSQASKLIAETITEIDRLREACAKSNIFPLGIGSISIRIKVGEEAVELNVGSPEPRALPPPRDLQAKHTMVMTYTIDPGATASNSSATTQITDTSGNPVSFKLDGKPHEVDILA